MASHHELAVIYAALILEDEGIAITGEKIQAILTAAGVQVEPFWPSLYAKALEGVNVKVSFFIFIPSLFFANFRISLAIFHLVLDLLVLLLLPLQLVVQLPQLKNLLLLQVNLYITFYRKEILIIIFFS